MESLEHELFFSHVIISPATVSLSVSWQIALHENQLEDNELVFIFLRNYEREILFYLITTLKQFVQLFFCPLKPQEVQLNALNTM